MEDPVVIKSALLPKIEDKSPDIVKSVDSKDLMSDDTNSMKKLTNLSVGPTNDNFDFQYEPIEESFRDKIVKKSVAEQYFEFRFCTENSDDYCVLFHSNRICVVTLAKSHSIIRHNKEIQKIEFKKKPGGKKNSLLQSITVVCTIVCTDNSLYKVRALITGKLMEINENLVNCPSLLVKEPTESGYLFILLPTKHNYEEFKNKYMTMDEYNKKIERSPAR